MVNLGKTQGVLDPRLESTATLGLGATVNSFAYRQGELENHIHSPLEIYGLTGGTMTRKSTSPIIVTGGSGAWGTEIVITHGAVIGGGSATKKFDTNILMVGVVGNASRLTYLEFFSWDPGSPVACTFVTATDKMHVVGTTLANNDKVVLPSIASNTGIDINTVYYVVNKTVDDVELSLTRGGAKVDILGADGAGTFLTLGASDVTGYAPSQNLISETAVCKLTTSADHVSVPMQMARQPCNRRMSCRAYALGGTNAVNFFVGLHTYSA